MTSPIITQQHVPHERECPSFPEVTKTLVLVLSEAPPFLVLQASQGRYNF